MFRHLQLCLTQKDVLIRLKILSVKPGITAGRLDRIARDIIKKEGYGWAFGHSLGHGLGLEVHENPALKKGGGGLPPTC